MDEFKYKVWAKEMIDKMRCAKEDLAKWMGLDNICFDYALPQEWLNDFVDRHKLDYDLVRTTTFYAYPSGLYSGMVSACKEIDDLIITPDSWTRSVQSDWPKEYKKIAKERIPVIGHESMSGEKLFGQKLVFMTPLMLPLWGCEIECECGRTWLWDKQNDYFVNKSGKEYPKTKLVMVSDDKHASIWTCECGRIGAAIFGS